MALTKTKTTVYASATRTAGAAATYGTLDCTSAYGGIVTMKITNGATGPTVQCQGHVLVSHETTLPTGADAGADWKTVFRFGGGTTANTVTEQSYVFGPEVRHIEVRFAGNTVQDVTVEAEATTFTV